MLVVMREMELRIEWERILHACTPSVDAALK